MAEETITVSPPYATYRQYDNFLNGLRDTAVPSRIDRSVFGNMSGGTAYSLLSALKFLKLIDDAGVPQTMLHALVEADDDTRKSLMAEVLRSAYPSLFGDSINLASASSGQFDDHIREQFGTRGSTVDKVALFFLTAAEDAGITLSAHLKGRKPTTPARKRQAGKKEAPGANAYTPPVPRQETRVKPLSHVLTDLLNVTDMTDDEMQAVWVLLRYQKRKEAAEAAAKEPKTE